jgi:hypothetical protein
MVYSAAEHNGSVLCSRRQQNTEENGYIPYTSPLHPPLPFVCNFNKPAKTTATVALLAHHHLQTIQSSITALRQSLPQPCRPFAAPVVNWLLHHCPPPTFINTCCRVTVHRLLFRAALVVSWLLCCCPPPTFVIACQCASVNTVVAGRF